MAHIKITFCTIIGLLMCACSSGVAQDKVTIENFIRAETHRHFENKVNKGDFGRLGHNRSVITVDNQYITRMNRDTRYSSGIFDLDAPLTVIMPQANDRYQLLTVTNEDHHIKRTIYEPGEYTFTKEEIGTRYVQVTVRTFVDANSTIDNERVTELQDKIKVWQEPSGKFEIPDWDESSRDKTRDNILKFISDMPDTRNMFGDEDNVSDIRHLIGTAAGYGGLPEKEAMYLNVYPQLNDGKTSYILQVPKDIPVDAFWSISVYDEKGYFLKNEFDAYSFNNVTAEKNADGSSQPHSYFARVEL